MTSHVTKPAQQPFITEKTVREFASQLKGQLIRPDDDAYDTVRALWNGLIDKRPAMIVQCSGGADVIRAIHFARHHDLPVAVRGGGHNVAGFASCDDGLVIDLSRMKGIRVDLEARSVRAEAGVTWGELDHQTQQFGLATPGGLMSETGIAGLTLSGGVGWLRSKYGLSCDNLVSVDLVTADGQLIQASETHNADLFWGIRGGGGNFGIVTSFEYRLYPVGPQVMFCFVAYPREMAYDVLRFYRDYCATAPQEVSSLAILGIVPAMEIFPPEVHGSPYLLLEACYVGDVEEGKRVLQPLREFAPPIADLSAPIPYIELQKMFDGYSPAGKLRYYWKSLNLTSMSDQAIHEILGLAENVPSPLSMVEIWPLGGAISRIGAEETAFRGRHVPYLLNVEANWSSPQDDMANIDWNRHVIEQMQPFSDGGSYLNFPGFLEEGDILVRASFSHNYERLVALKNKYDPTNVFRLNQNIRPTRES